MKSLFTPFLFNLSLSYPSIFNPSIFNPSVSSPWSVLLLKQKEEPERSAIVTHRQSILDKYMINKKYTSISSSSSWDLSEARSFIAAP
jgi:hypothetical protein